MKPFQAPLGGAPLISALRLGSASVGNQNRMDGALNQNGMCGVRRERRVPHTSCFDFLLKRFQALKLRSAGPHLMGLGRASSNRAGKVGAIRA
ncbi:hypothetical protein NL676_020139 [Syzygium grande]|nr:hypothetical protein NL676_020139 [Syzygium grande]